MKKKFQLSIVDPNSLSCEGIRHVLNANIFQIVDVWDNIEDLIDSAPNGAMLEGVLINLSKHDIPTQSIISRLRAAFPDARVALVGESHDSGRIREAINLEIDGFILETINIAAFSKAVELVILGERVFPPLLPDEIGDAGRLPASKPTASALKSLSLCELRVLALLAKAQPNKVIARNLGISESTVKVHVKSILRKTEARNRTDAALLVQESGAKAYFEELALEQNESAAKKRSDNMTRPDMFTVDPRGFP